MPIFYVPCHVPSYVPCAMPSALSWIVQPGHPPTRPSAYLPIRPPANGHPHSDEKSKSDGRPRVGGPIISWERGKMRLGAGPARGRARIGSMAVTSRHTSHWERWHFYKRLICSKPMARIYSSQHVADPVDVICTQELLFRNEE